MQSKMVFKICQIILCSQYYIMDFDVIVHKKKQNVSLYNPIKCLPILYPKFLTNLVVEVGIRHSQQILFRAHYHCGRQRSWRKKMPNCIRTSDIAIRRASLRMHYNIEVEKKWISLNENFRIFN